MQCRVPIRPVRGCLVINILHQSGTSFVINEPMMIHCCSLKSMFHAGLLPVEPIALFDLRIATSHSVVMAPQPPLNCDSVRLPLLLMACLDNFEMHWPGIL